SNLHIVEANPAAIRALGISAQGSDLTAEIAPEERRPFEEMLQRVRDQGKAPAVMVHLGQARESWLIRASMMTSGPGPMYMLQFSPVAGMQQHTTADASFSLDELMSRVPDAFVVLDARGTVLHANRAFLDLVQVASESSAIGQRLGRWLWRPGADLTVLLANIQRHGLVRLFSTTIHGELGSDTEVELSASGNRDQESQHIAVILRDVSRRLVVDNKDQGLGALLGPLTERIGNSSLRQLVQDTVGIVERHYIESALQLTSGNRTAAAELLGLSRQSLYAKLNRYDFDGDTAGTADNNA
ncbi:MAG: transcriptional regulator PpsR, partial [Kiloniellaceae bacterium]